MQFVLFLSADNGGQVAQGKVPFLCSFLEIESRVFLKICFYFFFVIS